MVAEPGPLLEMERPGDGIVLWRLNRPAKRNALNVELIDELDRAISAFAADDHQSVAILTANGPAFCAGIDLVDFASGGPRRPDSAPTVDRLARLAKPVIAAVNGPTATGGLEIVLACDWIIASRPASFADTHGKVGALPGGGLAARLAAAVGVRFAKQMSLTGEFVDSETALRVGLVNRVVPPAELEPAVIAMATAVAAGDQRVLRAMKGIYDRADQAATALAIDLGRRALADGPTDLGQIADRRADVIRGGSAAKS